MIIATKSGWLIAAELIREDEQQWHVKPIDSEHTMTVSKADEHRSVFDCVTAALEWMGESTLANSIKQHRH